jgi:hypothetical protein
MRIIKYLRAKLQRDRRQELLGEQRRLVARASRAAFGIAGLVGAKQLRVLCFSVSSERCDTPIFASLPPRCRIRLDF